MKLINLFRDRFEKGPFEQPATIRVFDDELRLEVRLSDSTRLGCLMEGLKLRSAQGNPFGLDPHEIARRITYLGEVLEVIETEGEQGKSVLRSNPPRTQGGRTHFFEMILDGRGYLSLGRYEWDPETGKRLPVSASLTREVLERLVADLVELVRGTGGSAH